MHESYDYADAPRIVIWEMTRACALACRHCRAEATPHRDSAELTTSEAFKLVDAVAECGASIFVLTGGDPFMRDDLNKVVEYATRRGLRVAVSPSATGRLTAHALAALSRAGCRRISLSIDAHDTRSHDEFRGVKGSFERTLAGVFAARGVGLEVQINTTISRFNHEHIADIAKLLGTLDIALWSLFFLVPVGRAAVEDVLDADQTETVFEKVYRLAQTLPFEVKTTEAPHYRRFVAQRAATPPLRYNGIGDGKGFVFVSHHGEIAPSGFLPHVVGNVRSDSLLHVYRDDPFMQRLRAPETFSGKCGICEFRNLCGGSRARAYTMTGNAFGSEPTCAYLSSPLMQAAHA